MKHCRSYTSRVVWTAFVAVLLPFLLISCGRGEREFERTGPVMGTVAEVKVVAPSEEAAGRALDAVFAELDAVDEAMSVYREGSDVARINASAGASSVSVGPGTIEVLEEAKSVSALSGGAFDATIGPLIDLWGFRSLHFREPGKAEVEAVLAGLVGFGNIIIDPERGTVRLAKPGMSIDLGGIAKGYGVDRAARALREAGMERGLVNVGGDLYCLGEKAWRVGIRHPRAAEKLMARIDVANAAVATSGDYENYFESGGRRYCHILDPRTGCPAETDVVSVTAVAGSCSQADAIATAVLVLGAADGMALVEGIDGADAVVAREEGGEIVLSVSGGLQGKVEIIDGMCRIGGGE